MGCASFTSAPRESTPVGMAALLTERKQKCRQKDGAAYSHPVSAAQTPPKHTIR
jgi:hypothetical protein